ncbi:uncharacterized protein DFL_005682 [Arthrobotrys flagrans]|uniref:transketolase n=1 Tax=Arthrobotrys flagrans TaxID=97331 RepID=A0A436ZY66_ARTFL|nr:hypothetical protein DFL_005682 [Arthrobotrys flagrans]
MAYTDLDTKCINTIRILAIDATSAANSGHPGAPMGMAPAAHVLFQKAMTFNPKNPKFLNRDRFVLSNGHGCMLHYALLHLYGYDLSIDDLKHFRQVGSKTPGHPEAHDTPGIEVTTGPLGQGISNAVGLAIAQVQAAATFNKPGFDLLNSHTYVFLGDGCLQEGVAAEAISLAGHLQLGNLIAVYDDNHITIDGDTNVSFTEDVLARFESYGWHTQHVKDGDNDLEAFEIALANAKAVTDKPSVIKLTTIIGYGSKLQGTHSVHGSPLKADDIKAVKEKFGFDPTKSFDVAPEVYAAYQETANKGAAAEQAWNELFDEYKQQYTLEAEELIRRFEKRLPEGWQNSLPVYKSDDPAIASRKLSETVLGKVINTLPELIGGSADLTGSNLTIWKGAVDFQPPSTKIGDYSGRYIRYGVREHGMGAIMNGIAAYGLHIPYGGTFLNFVSYAAGAVRLSALSQHQVIWVATHDSIGLADGNETSAAYYVALTSHHTPSVLCLSRQNLPQLENSTIANAIKGGYIVHEDEEADVTLISTGSEVGICVDAIKTLAADGIKARVVSLPCWEVFDTQDKEYRLSVLPDGIPILSVEVYTTLGWEKYSHEQFGLNRFGASGPYKDIYKKFEFTPEGIAKRAKATIDFWKGVTPIRSPINRAFTQLI